VADLRALTTAFKSSRGRRPSFSDSVPPTWSPIFAAAALSSFGDGDDDACFDVNAIRLLSPGFTAPVEAPAAAPADSALARAAAALVAELAPSTPSTPSPSVG